jgi:lysophospholipase L1-like esterase
MRYLALGDSMSIDQYTNVIGGGAVNQFSRLINADITEDLTYDGCTIAGVIEKLNYVTIKPDIITLTAGGNDLILCTEITENRREAVFSVSQSYKSNDIIEGLTFLYAAIGTLGCKVIVNNIYDPTDGDDIQLNILGFPNTFREIYTNTNNHIRFLAEQNNFMLSDLAILFRGHGMNAEDSWLTLQIEPNISGATAIANNWYELFMKFRV